MKLLRSASALKDSYVDILDHLYLFFHFKAAGKIWWLFFARLAPYNFLHLRRRLPGAAGGEIFVVCSSVGKMQAKKWINDAVDNLSYQGLWGLWCLSQDDPLLLRLAAYCRDDRMPTKNIALLTVCFLSSPGITFDSSSILGGSFTRRLCRKASRV